jgi:NhaP-type Na+/H+ or K+/H+ antiporter/voltage-gated potassium channel Kch
VQADPALLTLAAAAVAGLFAQVLGDRWRIPAIVPLLVIGMVLGPSGIGLVQPAALGSGLAVLVKLAVAVILFDGALNLRLGDLRGALRDVRNLATTGALVTWIGAGLAAWLIAGFSGRLAVVFGALVTVTGPTVVQPLMRRVRVSRRLKTVLEGEAILIDPIGAFLAITVVNVLLGLAGVRPIGFFATLWSYAGRIIVGGALGVAGAFALSWLLNRRGLVSSELANLVALVAVWGVFGLSEAIKSESGIMSSVAMGLTMQSGTIPGERLLRRFKEQLTVLGISLIFILLSANLPLSVVMAEGVRGLLTVLALMWIVRPLSVWAALRNSTLTIRERMFVAWISPRGIVAASVASLFALELTEAGIVEGERMLAITFLTIAVTVTVQGLTAGPVARLLGLESLRGRRVIVVGAGPLALSLASVIRRYDRPVTVIDRNAELIDRARSLDVEAVAGNALDEPVLEAAGADEAESVVALTSNPEVNALAAHLAHDAFGVAAAYPSLADPTRGASSQLLERVGGRLAFGRAVDVRSWDYALEHGGARVFVFRVPKGAPERPRIGELPSELLVLARVRDQSLEIATAQTTWRGGDHLVTATTLPEGDAVAVLDDASRSAEASVGPS